MITQRKLYSVIVSVLLMNGIVYASNGGIEEEREEPGIMQEQGERTPAEQPVKTVIEKTFKASDAIILEPIAMVKDQTNEMLDGKMELVGSEKSNEDSEPAPKFKMTF